MSLPNHPVAAITPGSATQAASPAPPTPAKPAVHKAFLKGLNTLRAIAALSVCFFHFTNGALPKVIVPFTQHMFSQGGLGVDVFFVLSGFIIPYSLLGKDYRHSGFLPYFKKRLIRINPPAYVAMLLVIMQGLFIDIVIHHTNVYGSQLSFGQVLNNIFFTIPFTDYKWIVGIFWTLAIEFQFYLFIGLLFALLFESRSLLWFVGVYLLSDAAQFIPGMAFTSFFAFSPLFAMGGVALLWQQQRLSKPLYVGFMVLFTSLAYWQQGGYIAGVGLATALVINLLKNDVPGLDFVGKISYSFYLLHVLIGTTCEFVLIKIIPPTTTANKLIITGLSVAVALVGAYLFYHFVEQPFMRLASKKAA
jgi:peptidoglycan/LPS O-acetylase OafA/YrhL